MYLYCFDRQMPGDDAGAFHSSELWYEFGTLDRCWRPFIEADYRLSDTLPRVLDELCQDRGSQRRGTPGVETLPRDRLQMRLGIDGCAMVDYDKEGGLTRLEDALFRALKPDHIRRT
jgi:hypothetical protein